jgi:hypothetical protein
MSNSRAIHRWSSKPNSKDIIFVFSRDMNMLRTSLVMKQLCSHQFKLWNLFNLHHVLVESTSPRYLLHRKSMQRVASFQGRSKSSIRTDQMMLNFRDSPAKLSHSSHGHALGDKLVSSSKFPEKIFAAECCSNIYSVSRKYLCLPCNFVTSWTTKGLNIGTYNRNLII